MSPIRVCPIPVSLHPKPRMSPTITDVFITSFGLSLSMVAAAGGLAVLLGLPAGILLYAATQLRTCPTSAGTRSGGIIRRACRHAGSMPIIMVLASALPLAQFALGGDAGLASAIVSLTLIATPFFARRVHDALSAVDAGIAASAIRRGATKWQVIFRLLLPQASPSIATALGLTLASLVGYSTLASALVGQGLGDLGLRYGYQQFQPMIMLAVAAVSIALAEAAQALGNMLAMRLQNGPAVRRTATQRPPPR